MNQHSPTLRAADPTHDDGLAFAHYLDEAAEGFFRILLGRRVRQILAAAFLEPGHDLSYEHVTFAEHDKTIVGMVSGYSAVQHRNSSLRPLNQAAGRWRLRMRVASTVFAPLVRIIDSIGDDDFYIQAIAVDEEFRGQGIGELLMAWIEEQARASEATRLCLDVSAGNQRARRFYERHGMAIESQWPKRLFIPGLRIYRMAKCL